MLKALLIPIALVALSATLSAQTTEAPDTFKVNYFSNANTGGAPDGTVRITNVGTQIGNKADTDGDICALVYVLAPDQQLSECCGCLLTPDSLSTLSVNDDLTSNPLTPAVLTTGDIKIISSLPGSTGCNPTKPSPAAAIRSWATHIQNGGSITETEFSDSTLSAGEMNHLASTCKGIFSNGSGFGVCSCGTGF